MRDCRAPQTCAKLLFERLASLACPLEGMKKGGFRHVFPCPLFCLWQIEKYPQRLLPECPETGVMGSGGKKPVR
jgi:hypothetical protein